MRYPPSADSAPIVTGDPVAVLMPVLDKILTNVMGIRDQLARTRKPYYTVEEVANLTGRTAYTVRRWIGEKRIKAERVAGTGPKGRLLIAGDQLDALIVAGHGADVPATALVDRR